MPQCSPVRAELCNSGLSEQSEAAKIPLGPARLEFDHAFQSARAKGIGGVVKGNRHASPVWVDVMAMASLLPLECESVGFERGHKPPSGERS